MLFDRITEDGRLWAVRYDSESDNALIQTFRQWHDLEWLADFFIRNVGDLASYFMITDVNRAIFDTVEDAYELECLIMDISPDISLDDIFRPLENLRSPEALLGKEKAKGFRRSGHDSWLRLYAIRFGTGFYIITGGAVKLTRTMEEREHTLQELHKMEKVRNFLLGEGVVDIEGFYDMTNTGL